MSAPDSQTNPFAHAQFRMSCAKLDQLPADGLPELAFVGRSNAGKSSALNTLCQQKSLARVSRTPGRTQLINLFELRGGQVRLVAQLLEQQLAHGPRHVALHLEPNHFTEAALKHLLLDRFQQIVRLVDLPGYGFAAVPMAIKRDWGRLIGGYLETRDSLKTLAVIMDSRHPLTDLDEQMLDWAAASGRPCHVLLTKCDKLSRGAGAATLLQVRKALSARGPGFTAQLFSSHTGQGADEARRALLAAVVPE